MSTGRLLCTLVFVNYGENAPLTRGVVLNRSFSQFPADQIIIFMSHFRVSHRIFKILTVTG